MDKTIELYKFLAETFNTAIFTANGEPVVPERSEHIFTVSKMFENNTEYTLSFVIRKGYIHIIKEKIKIINL